MNPQQIYLKKEKLQKSIKILCRNFEKETNTVVTEITNRNTDNNGCLDSTKEVSVICEDDYCIYK